MACIIEIASKPRQSAVRAAGLLLGAVVAVGAFAGSADAQYWNGNRGYNHGWNGGYYRAPPVVYGSPYATTYYGAPVYAPPVVYGPPVGLNIQIR
jgi:hypothetical protein